MVYIWNGKSADKKVIAELNEYNISEVIGMVGHILVSFEGKYVREGAGNNGNILANLEGDFIREGDNNTGKAIAIIRGNEIKQAGSEGKLLFKIEGIASKIEKAALTVAALMLEGQI